MRQNAPPPLTVLADAAATYRPLLDRAEAARRHADLVIAPRAEGVGLMEFHQLDRARGAGREAAREALERLDTGVVA